MILAGDIGGTKTNLAVFSETDADMRTPIIEASYPSKQHASLESILDKFLEEYHVDVKRAGFGIAGPILGGQVETPNLPWKITESSLAERLKTDRVRLINDLVANAHGIPSLGPDQLFTINEGEPVEGGNRALVSAGTGCGMTFLVNVDGRDVPVGSEGGHVDFAARTAEEFGLLEYLRKRYGRVSYERVLSGPGLHSIYSYLRDDASFAREEDWLAEEISTGDPGAAISKAALAGTSPLAGRALDIFVSIYGAVAGNLALMVIATRGVYIGGGIAPKILPKLQDGLFWEAFRQKGRFMPMIEKIPIRVILDPKAALYGAARVASSL